MISDTIRERIRILICQEGGGSLNSMRWTPLANVIYERNGGDSRSKNGKNFVKTATVDDITNMDLTEGQWLEIFEHVVRRASKQM